MVSLGLWNFDVECYKNSFDNLFKVENMSFNLNGFDKMLEKIKLGNSFLAFGGVGLLLSVYANNTNNTNNVNHANNELGIKLFLLMFIFGGIFRLFNIMKPVFFAFDFENEFADACVKYLIRSLVWLNLLMLFAYLVNKHITIF